MDKLISQQAAINICRKTKWNGADDYLPMSARDIENEIRALPSAQHRDNDYSYMGDPWEYFANTKDGDLSEAEKQIKFIMWAGYAKGKKAMRETQPEREKETIQKFHDYQIEWFVNHYGLEPQLKELIIRFLHDTANMYLLEIGREE